jgi:hypothetical protein
MRKLLFLLPTSLFALNIEPWFCNVYEFTFSPYFTYSRYRDVQNGHPQLKSPSNDYVVGCDIAVPPAPQWEVDADVEFADTPRQSMGLRSSGLQIRYLWLDDVLGDAVSLTTGVSARGVSKHSLHDVSSPYHSQANFELTTSIGREWDRGFQWRFRTYGFGAAGMGNRGYPWARAIAVVEGNQHNTHRLSLFAEGYMGFGPHKRVRTNHFDGYASIQHRNFDMGIQYTYVTEIWGRITLAYTRRLYARSFPENVNFFTIGYMLPFSLF